MDVTTRRTEGAVAVMVTSSRIQGTDMKVGQRCDILSVCPAVYLSVRRSVRHVWLSHSGQSDNK